ncbi:MAG TPA: SdpI family protein [Blastocatellia bacterium]|nr:SdpI family protein [Blastocatellia bacterium]
MAIYEYLLMVSDMLLILCGATMYWFSPRLRRNWLLGYGTPRSMANDATWQSANRFAGIVLSLLALVAMAMHITLLPVINAHDLAQALAVAAVLVLPFLVMALTETYLARVFRA